MCLSAHLEVTLYSTANPLPRHFTVTARVPSVKPSIKHPWYLESCSKEVCWATSRHTLDVRPSFQSGSEPLYQLGMAALPAGGRVTSELMPKHQ